ncbi:MAG: mechanosensitive ion channel family protein, partial [Nanoarchaeota archaeon]
MVEIMQLLGNQYVKIGLLVVFTLMITILLEKIIAKFISKLFLYKSQQEKTLMSHHHTLMRNFLKGLVYLIGIGVAIYLIPPLRAISISILASAGVLAIVFGFAAQQAFSNIISGIFIIIFKPFRIGDRVKVKDNISGVVEDITLRHTVIKTFENKRFILPNSIMGNEVIENASFGDEEICKYIDFGISYDSDIDKAMKIMRDEAMKHPNFIDHRTEEEKKKREPAVTVRVIGVGDSSVNIRAWVLAKDPSSAFILG